MNDVYTLAKNLNIAKLVQPDVSGLLERERLFELLDKSDNGFGWVMGPAGAGKTSLLTSWVKSRKKNTLWYRVDIADSDPATFFHYFSLALGEFGKSVPAFSVEHIPNLEMFARRYFRACFQSLPKNTVIIFDNCHSVPAEDTLFLLLHWLLEERVPGCSIVCSSRQAVPSRLNTWQVMPNYSYIGWEALLSTHDEADQVAKLLGYSGLPKDVYEYTGGWLAGLVLQLKVNNGDALDPVQRHDADHMAVLFSVFAEGA
ncbi:MAG TPA: AAA family ATPase, partial [Pseudomonadales bacterium]|nr:AAA family ATPase [Pseudomonadales bacterium]